MTLEQYKAIIDCYKDFYTQDEMSSGYMSSTLKEALESKEEDVSHKDVERTNNIDINAIG